MKRLLLGLYHKMVAKAVLDRYKMIQEGICLDCREKYVGLALDCRCTNWGRPSSA